MPLKERLPAGSRAGRTAVDAAPLDPGRNGSERPASPAGTATTADVAALRRRDLRPPPTGTLTAAVGAVDRSPLSGTAVAFAAVAFAVVAFSWGWLSRGALVLDGSGVSMYLRLALDHARAGRIPYWMPEMWAGAPVWALAPSFPTFSLLPIAFVAGPENTLKLAMIAFQILGGWGTFVLARSLWGRDTAAPLVAGVLYALHPLIISHGALYGNETTLGVLAALPWLVWSFRLSLQGKGPEYVALAGLLAGFAVLQQAEHAYGVALICGLVLLQKLVHERDRGLGRLGADGMLLRTAVIGLIGVGVTAHWLLPFLSLSKSFVLSPPSIVRDFLTSSPLANEPGVFLRRTANIGDPIAFDLTDILNGPFYLSWVCVTLSVPALLMLRRRDEDGTLRAIVLGSAIALWMSTAAVPLSRSGPARRGEVIAFVLLGITTGILLGNFIRRLRFRRRILVGAAAAAALVVMPYVTPFLTLQRWVPLLASMRFPRFYPVAVLGVALAAAYPITRLHEWARGRQPVVAPLLSVAAALAVIAVFLVDIHPYRKDYDLHRVDPSAYRAVEGELEAADAAGYRVATDRHAVPEDVDVLLKTGVHLSVGWPHPVASRDLWPLTVTALTGPVGFRNRALALSATKYVVKEEFNDPHHGPPALERVTLEENPSVLPMARAYEQAVVVADEDLAPVLATSLAQKNVVTVTGRTAAARALGDVPHETVGAADGCGSGAQKALPPELAGEVALACGLRGWVDYDSGLVELGADGSGATFRADLDGLQGISARLDRLPGRTELSLHELMPDGRTLGREVAHATSSSVDENELAYFAFPAIPDSAGRQYAFLLTCHCPLDEEPKLMQSRPAERGRGNLIVDGQLSPRYDAAFTLRYDRMAPAGSPTTNVVATRSGPGRWTVASSGFRPAVVVVAETYFPGWRATVDGRPAPVLEADGAFLGVAVTPGVHTIRLEYERPAAATFGRLVTLVSLAGALLLVGAGVRRRARRRRAHPGRATGAGDAGPIAAPPADGRTRRPASSRVPLRSPPPGRPTDGGPSGAGGGLPPRVSRVRSNGRGAPRSSSNRTGPGPPT